MPTFSTLRDPQAILDRLGGTRGLARWLELAVVVLLALQAARLAWLLLPPAGLGAAPPDAAAFAARPDRLAIDAFHPVAAAAAPAAVDGSGLKLFAVRPAGSHGSAILAMGDGPQRSILVGEGVVPGVTLAAVEADQVVLESSGRCSELRFAAAVGAPARAVPLPTVALGHTATAVPPADAAEPAAIDPAELLADMGLRPDMADGRIAGYTVVPRGNGDALRRSGLQAGDLLLSVNNEALDPERHAALAGTLASGSSITLTYRRDGRIHSATLQAKTP